MAKALHIVDRTTPAEMLRQLSLLSGEGDVVVSVGPAPTLDFGLTVHAVHAPLGSASFCALRMSDLGEDVDVVHAWSARCHRAGEVLAGARGCGLVRSLPAVPPPGRQLASLLRRCRRGGFILTVPTENARQCLLRAGLAAASVVVLPPPAAVPDDLRQRRSGMRSRLGLSPQEFVIVAPGEIIRPAGHKLAVWVHAILRYVQPYIRLLLPDTGPLAKSIYNFARGAGFPNELHGPWAPADRMAALAAADVAVFFHDGDCGVGAAVEAMAASLPIVAAASPDLSECLARAAHFVEPPITPRSGAKGVLTLMDDDALARRLADAARRRAERFTVLSARAVLHAVYAAGAASLEGASLGAV